MLIIKKLINVGQPENNGDVVNKSYLDNELIIKTDKKYVDDNDNKLLPLDGSRSMTSNLNMNFNKIININADPDKPEDLINKAYVDKK